MTYILANLLASLLFQQVHAGGDKVLTMSMTTEHASLHPFFASPASGNYILQFAYRTWTSMDEKYAWRPSLAQRIPNFKDKTLSEVTEKVKKS